MTWTQEFNYRAQKAYEHAIDKGFEKRDGARNFGEIVALIHTEVSEAMEGHRAGNPASEHIPEFSAIEEEFADVIIRIMNAAAANKWRVAEAIDAKMRYNATREFMHGGKRS